ncbi:transcriptional regulator [Virgisporangium aliadipatigenens]|uniref:Transcriptional regulator n=1 Tax=Virgisporangium aliadipatigenens TaxID=741659 RepID=A0A8J3YPP0_9ACTN|nr:PadR family transcriptional regulator [Virgisporangium aliadipatigenens]GIJ47616.1 transcriptional regulator [Virgisporangium aliadipatigenens]
MSATRLLILGLVRGLGTAHGYAIHNELVSWGAGEWANVKWGSIYHALRQMEKEGKLRQANTDECTGRVDYAVTEAGEEEFQRLLRKSLRDRLSRPDLLCAGLALMTSLPRGDAIALLKERVAEAEQQQAELAAGAGQLPPGTPGHVAELFGYWRTAGDNDIAWARGLIDRLSSGAYTMADE